MRFEIIEHTADIGISAHGRDLAEAFANCAYGMFSLIADLEEVGDGVCREVEVWAEDREALLVAWLNELLYIFDVDNLLFKRFDIEALDQNRLRAKVYGEKVDPSRHHLKTAVKAATYHLLKVEREDGFKVQVILDI